MLSTLNLQINRLKYIFPIKKNALKMESCS